MEKTYRIFYLRKDDHLDNVENLSLSLCSPLIALLVATRMRNDGFDIQIVYNQSDHKVLYANDECKNFTEELLRGWILYKPSEIDWTLFIK